MVELALKVQIRIDKPTEEQRKMKTSKNEFALGSAVPVTLPSTTKVDRDPVKQKVPSPTQADETRAQKAFHQRVIAQADEDMRRIYGAP